METPEGLEWKESPVAGMGIFATRDFPSDYFFGLFKGVEYSLREFKERYGKDVRHCYQLTRQNKILCAKETRNWITYLNESMTPNLVLKKKGAWSARAIKTGEELFLKYPNNYPRDY
jgi:hypothetical protein